MRRARQAGWTIIEFVIALGLGLMLTLLASGLLLAASGNYRHHAQSAAVNDGGRYALEIMAQAIRQSAYLNWDGEAAPAGMAGEAAAAIAGLDARSIARNAEGIDGALPAQANGSDVLALRFAGHGEGASGDGSSVNCGGFGVAAPADEDARGWSIFYVAVGADGDAELRCKYRGAGGWGADAIVSGVDTFQVLYGLDTDAAPDGVPNTYLNADALNELDAALPLVGATPVERERDLHRKTHWKRVCSVKLALLLHGEDNTRADQVAARFDLFGAAYALAHGEDAGVRVEEARMPLAQRWRTRRSFSLTVALRNRGA